ncbi:MAG: hypothetical protein IKM98_04960 [Bacteroidales bacterium]|nr:hypothetical protein [Bacteroidales bacterium]
MAINDVTMRFSNTVSWLISNKKAQDKKEIAAILGISTSLMTEISKERSNVGVVPLQNIVIKYGISGDWLLTGEGSMLKSETSSMASEETPDESPNAALNTLKGIIKEQALDIARLELEVSTLKKRLENG